MSRKTSSSAPWVCAWPALWLHGRGAAFPREYYSGDSLPVAAQRVRREFNRARNLPDRTCSLDFHSVAYRIPRPRSPRYFVIARAQFPLSLPQRVRYHHPDPRAVLGNTGGTPTLDQPQTPDLRDHAFINVARPFCAHAPFASPEQLDRDDLVVELINVCSRLEDEYDKASPVPISPRARRPDLKRTGNRGACLDRTSCRVAQESPPIPSRPRRAKGGQAD